MSESKHTPGPWTRYPCNLEKYSQVITAKGAMVQIAVTTPGRLVNGTVAMTKAVYGDRMTYGPGEETTANARLIAAAPALYEALAALVERGTDSPEHMAAERALALARGEA